MENVTIMDHPLIQHKISRLRDKTTGTNEFRTLVSEIAMLMGFEALRDLPTELVEIETPIETTKQPMIAGKKMAIVPILRAGLGMVDGVLNLVPSAKIGHIGLYRDPETHEPHEYYCKLPEPIDQRTILVVDPMLATGGSGADAITMIKQHGGKNIKFMCIIAAPEGLERLHKEHPDVQIYVGALDRQLNENAYICPGLGDAGDRIFGTKNMGKNIVLIGMPGVGKSTSGVILAKVLNYDFLDSDLVIQHQTGKLLKEIIAEKGIDGFNAVENEINSQIDVENTVIATGGSVIFGADAMAHFKESGIVVYLRISYDLLDERLGDLDERGVVHKEGQTLRDIYNERTALYEKYADITVDLDGKDVAGTVDAVVAQLEGK